MCALFRCRVVTIMPNNQFSNTFLLENSGENCIGLFWPIIALSKPSPETYFSKPHAGLSFENWDYVRIGAPTAQRTHRRSSAQRATSRGAAQRGRAAGAGAEGQHQCVGYRAICNNLYMGRPKSTYIHGTGAHQHGHGQGHAPTLYVTTATTGSHRGRSTGVLVVKGHYPPACVHAQGYQVGRNNFEAFGL